MTAIPEPVEEACSAPQAHTVLVVDDSRAQRRVLSLALKRWGYSVFEAASGEAALEQLRAQTIDIVISDWMMPGIDGLEFCRRLRAATHGTYVYFILLTSKNQTREVAHGLDVGADDFLTKPVIPELVRARLAAGDRILRMARELEEKNALISSAFEQLSAAQESFDRDLREARKLQQSLVRERTRSFGTAEIACLLQPSGHVGGDLVGHFRIGRTRLGVYAIDVSGHGVASALMTARLAGYLTGSSPKQNIALTVTEAGEHEMRPPDEVCAMLNELLLEELETDLYFTMSLADIDLATGHVRFVQAGHPNPAVQKASGEVAFLGEGGLPIGLIAGATWTVMETQLDPGDRILFYSDGLTEASDGAGGLLEEDGLARLLVRHRGLDSTSLLEALVWDLEAMSEDGSFSDDISGVFLSYFGPA